MSGLVAVTAVLGCAVPASAASATPAADSVSHAVPARALASSSGSFTFGSRISCGSPRACLAVGSKTAASGNPVATAEAWNGAKWKSVAVKTPKGFSLSITGVSCKSARSCLVIGSYTANASGNMLPYTMTWNGSALKPTAKLAVPKGRLIALDALDCVTAKHCVAFGSMAASGAKSVMLVATWNGRKWAKRTVRNPGGARLVIPTAASCRSLTSCVITGDGISAKGFKIQFARWNGKSFKPMKAAAPAGLPVSLVTGLSCASAKRCVAVGIAINASGKTSRGFAEMWKGGKWTPAKIAWPKANRISLLVGVSCLSPSNCVAVGAAGTSNAGTAKALHYNGKKWAFQRVPGTGKGKSSILEDVSCPKARDCVTIGEIGPSNGNTTKMLGGVWKGAAWRLMAA